MHSLAFELISQLLQPSIEISDFANNFFLRHFIPHPGVFAGLRPVFTGPRRAQYPWFSGRLITYVIVRSVVERRAMNQGST